ncbi:hypothetical protein MON38_17255 [Hymenobacter sp. DH14]|uniref:Uncharacterized protein n=1 Tax=Hymenobacter cyanobacteriorum TaxID=2926463 RepID=A0A9X2AJS7_9BACT|nr:hypothetical protein [Hymenobacter cyanobacteriorum]MCI1189174.1 hypothetical protein [Hymenobacter cyanobacteriorum]
MPTPPAPRSYRLLSAGNVALVSAAVVVVTTVAVWLLGLGQHRTLFANSLISTSILFGAFFLFTAVGLYHGVKLRDDVGRLTDRISRKNFPGTSGLESLPDFDFSEGHGILGILAAIVMAVVVAILAVFVIWLVGALLWTGILIFAALLYWVFFRALRLVFKNSNRCRGRLGASLWEGFWYASLYTCWIYGIIMAAHYLG